MDTKVAQAGLIRSLGHYCQVRTIHTEKMKQALYTDKAFQNEQISLLGVKEELKGESAGPDFDEESVDNTAVTEDHDYVLCLSLSRLRATCSKLIKAR